MEKGNEASRGHYFWAAPHTIAAVVFQWLLANMEATHPPKRNSGVVHGLNSPNYSKTLKVVDGRW